MIRIPSTALFVALSKEGSKMRFNCIARNTKLIEHWFIKSLVFQLGRNSHSEKKNPGRLNLAFEANVESQKPITSFNNGVCK